MSVGHASLDFDRLVAPAQDGGVLVMPDAGDLARHAESNAQRLDGSDIIVAGVPLSDLRAWTRRRLVGAGTGPIIATGHQPEFIHPGVWAKHVVSTRLARALDGTPINLIVDNDAPRHAGLNVPYVRGNQAFVRFLSHAHLAPGWTYEQIPTVDRERWDALETEMRALMERRFERSQMPRFFEAIRALTHPVDSVEQTVHARRAIEAHYDVSVADVRVSAAPLMPMMVDLFLRAESFHAAYNRALADYRRRYRVRSPQRPIPDLTTESGRFELPLWIHRADQPRRRLLIEPRDDRVVVWADREPAFEISRSSLCWPGLADTWTERIAPWLIRPRALTLTLWARLLASDLFVHGIGGAKYDRITDRIIADHYGIEPPVFACVSATLRLGLPRCPSAEADVVRARQALRDLRYNPQRCVGVDDDIRAWIDERAQAVDESRRLRRCRPHDRAARREVYRRIRRLNDHILEHRPRAWTCAQERLARAKQTLDSERIARARDYFFGLFDRPALERLLERLPSTQQLGAP